MKKEKFHHGNLREELLKIAMQTLNEKGVEGLSLRNLAQISGVSPTAPYRHFKSKNALILALAEEGFNRLSNSYERAKESAQSDEKCLALACVAYLECAEDYPHLFKLMFIDMDLFHGSSNGPVTEKYGYLLFEQLVTGVSVAAGKSSESNFREVSISTWALLHGFATLHMSGRLNATNYDKEQAIKAVIALVNSA